MAFLNAFWLFELMAFITMVEPSVIVRTSIFEVRPTDHLKPSIVISSDDLVIITSTHAVTKGLKSSVGMA